jgi:hypothetical protein
MAKKTKIEQRSMTRIVDGAVVREPKNVENGPQRYFWWKVYDSDEKATNEVMANQIASTIKFMMENYTQRLNQLIVSTRLYGNSSPYNVLGAAFTRSSNAMPNQNGTRISFNLCASVVDTITAQVAKNKVVPTFITSGARWGLQRKAEQLNKFVEGLLYEINGQDLKTYQARDAAVWGDGFLHPYVKKNGRIDVKRIVPHEMVWDLVESLTGELRQIHRLYIYDRGLLLDQYPDKADIIEKCNPASYQDIAGAGTAADLVVVSESWHLRSGEDAKDGVYVKCLHDMGQVLECSEYDKDYFPFPTLQYSKRLVGVDGQGACERLQNLQGEINRLMILDQKSRWLNASFKILSHISDRIPAQHFNNEVGPVLKWAGNIEPKYITPSPIDPSNEQKIDSLIAKGYQQEGVSQLSASNLKPSGVNSGAALRTYDTIAEDRQLFFGQRVEGSVLELVKQCIELVKDVYKEKGTYKVQYPSSHFLEEIDWKDINLEMDEYWLKAFPTSELPEEPSAKLQTVQEYVQAGFITPRAARRLMTMPDVEMADNLANAAEDLICKTIEDIIYDGNDDVVPDPEWDLNLAQQYCIQYLNYAKLNGCPEKNIAKLRDFKLQVDDQLGLLQPPPQPAAPVPQAQPMAPPTSDLIQNVPGGQ